MMRRILGAAVVAVGVVCSVSLLGAHDLFLRPDHFDVAPNTSVIVPVLNGTFAKSENSVTVDRLTDLSAVRGGTRVALDRATWRDAGDTSRVRIETGSPGTLLIAAAIAPRLLALDAKAFNAYLADDGIPDILAERTRTKSLDQPSRERYSKHIKTLLNVGGVASAGFDVVLGHAAELVPLENPYAVARGATLRVRALVEGAPVARQLVLAGGRDLSGQRIPVQTLRTDSAGIARVRLSHGGAWYVKFIHMVPGAAGDSVTYVSKWASLTFGVRR